MTDVSLKNSQAWLENLGFSKESEYEWVCPEHPAKTPGVGMIPAQHAIIEQTVVTTYMGADEEGRMIHKPLPPEKWHRTISMSFIKGAPQ